ncbi:hypothetical protein JCM10207_005302 [Rhodosporidiobolus poonsookiae]
MAEALLAALATQTSLSYILEVVQQPVRARMCGFGDKDRRPISPPLIIKLSARDPSTGEMLSVDDIDTTFLVLAADLRTPDCQGDANLIYPPNTTTVAERAKSQTPPSPKSASSQYSRSRGSSPTSPPSAYPSPSDTLYSPSHTPLTMSPPKSLAPLPEEPLPSGLTGGASPESEPKPFAPPSTASTKRRLSSSLEPPNSLAFSPAKRAPPSEPNSPNAPSAAAVPPSSNANFIPYARDRRAPPLSAEKQRLAPEDDPDATPIANLLGSLHTNAYRLKAPDDEKGIYFVLPDLSVRTEGSFRIRLRLVSIGLGGVHTNTGTGIVATEHTDEFKVFSAKKFEGMLDPTPLSQCFAKQGVRIPTRKVAKARAPATGKAATLAAAAKQAAAVH